MFKFTPTDFYRLSTARSSKYINKSQAITKRTLTTAVETFKIK